MPGFEVIGSEEFDEVKDVFDRGGVLFRHGFDAIRNDCYKTKEFEQEFSKAIGSDHALAVSSGTAALRVALAALEIGAGDEVITQSFTFVATVEAIIESKATPVCCEIDRTLNMSPDDLLSKINDKTKAVIVVHMLGTPAKLNEISEICKKHGIALIEDTAWGCGGNLDGKSLGTWGQIGTFSFDFAKTMTTGEGGMLIFEDKELYDKAAAWHDHGHENNPAVPRWEDTRSSSGFNFRMTELQGAVGLAQLRKLPDVIKAQRENRDKIWNEIKDIPGISLRESPSGSYDTADALVFFVEDSMCANNCREALLEKGLGTKILPEAYTWHFAATWNHMPELVGSSKIDLNDRFTKSNEILSSAVALPIFVNLEENVPQKIRGALIKALKHES